MSFANPKELLRIDKVALKHGGVHIIGNKQVGKSNAKKVLASLAIRSLKQTKSIIIDTVGLWRFDFDKIAFYTIPKNALRIGEQPIGFRINGLPFYEKTYRIDTQTRKEVDYLLEGKQPILFDLELESPLECGFFSGYVLSKLYEKQRIRRKYHKGKLSDSYLLFLEESENLFDSGFDRKMLSKIRKKYNECANLKIGFISSAQRLVETSTKYRAKASFYLIGKTSLDDYDLKLRRLLRHSAHRKDILELEVGSFLDTSKDRIVKFPRFEQKGLPYEVERGFLAKPTPQPRRLRMVKAKRSLWQRVLSFLGVPQFGKATSKDESEDASEEHTLLASNEDEETESLFFD